MQTKEQLLQDYQRLLTLKNYATSTCKLYLRAVQRFWQWSEKQQGKADYDKKQAVFLYLSERMKTKRFTTVNAEYSGLKMFFVSILDREWNVDKLPRPRKEKPLPVILSKQEVEALISHSGSFRNQVMLTLIYATGLRLGELARLQLVDINSQSMTIHVHNGKGAKDRVLPLPTDLLPLLREYYQQYKPVGYLFNGTNNEVPLSKRMIQHVVEQARVAAGIRRKASVHTLRHCYATHVYQEGANGLALQLMLGHKNFKTTTRYIHLSGDHYRGITHPAQDLCKQLHNRFTKPSSEPPSTP
jgi:integrase/recombinase XerD